MKTAALRLQVDHLDHVSLRKQHLPEPQHDDLSSILRLSHQNSMAQPLKNKHIQQPIKTVPSSPLSSSKVQRPFTSSRILGQRKLTIQQEQKFTNYYQRNLKDEVERVLHSPCVSSRGLSQSSTLKQIVIPNSQPEIFFANRVSLYTQKSHSRPQSTLLLSGLQSPQQELEDRATKRVEKTFLKFVHDNHKRQQCISKLGEILAVQREEATSSYQKVKNIMEVKTKQELELVNFMSKCEGKTFKQSKERFYKRFQQRKYSRQWETHKVDELTKLNRARSPYKQNNY